MCVYLHHEIPGNVLVRASFDYQSNWEYKNVCSDLRGAKMTDWIEFVASLNVIDYIDGFVSTFQYADWKGAFDSRGVNGLIDELVACFTARNCWTIQVQRHAGWSGVQIEKLLARYGVSIWGRGFTQDNYFFRVKERQSRWAEYLLMRRGIPVTSTPYDPHNPDYAERHTPGNEPRS